MIFQKFMLTLRMQRTFREQVVHFLRDGQVLLHAQVENVVEAHVVDLEVFFGLLKVNLLPSQVNLQVLRVPSVSGKVDNAANVIRPAQVAPGLRLQVVLARSRRLPVVVDLLPRLESVVEASGHVQGESERQWFEEWCGCKTS